jgi:hypothetical protein
VLTGRRACQVNPDWTRLVTNFALWELESTGRHVELHLVISIGASSHGVNYALTNFTTIGYRRIVFKAMTRGEDLSTGR